MVSSRAFHSAGLTFTPMSGKHIQMFGQLSPDKYQQAANNDILI